LSTESILLYHDFDKLFGTFPKSFVFTTVDYRLPIFKLVSQFSNYRICPYLPEFTLFPDIARLDKPLTRWELQGGISKKEIFPQKVQDPGTD